MYRFTTPAKIFFIIGGHYPDFWTSQGSMMVGRLKTVAHDISGATAIEYALIASLISAAIIVAVQMLFNDSVTGLYSWFASRALAAMGL
jgi:Flp pilus assembly pilin Flp